MQYGQADHTVTLQRIKTMGKLNMKIAFQESEQQKNINLAYSTDQTYLLNQILKNNTIMVSAMNHIGEMMRRYILRTNPDLDTISASPTTPYWEHEDKFKVNPVSNSGLIYLQPSTGKNAASKDGYIVFLEFFSDSADADNPGTWTFYINGIPISPLTNKSSSLVANKSNQIGRSPTVIPFKAGDQITYIATNTSSAIVEFSLIAAGWFLE